MKQSCLIRGDRIAVTLFRVRACFWSDLFIFQVFVWKCSFFALMWTLAACSYSAQLPQCVLTLPVWHFQSIDPVNPTGLLRNIERFNGPFVLPFRWKIHSPLSFHLTAPSSFHLCPCRFLSTSSFAFPPQKGLCWCLWSGLISCKRSSLRAIFLFQPISLVLLFWQLYKLCWITHVLQPQYNLHLQRL